MTSIMWLNYHNQKSSLHICFYDLLKKKYAELALHSIFNHSRFQFLLITVRLQVQLPVAVVQIRRDKRNPDKFYFLLH